MTVFSSKIIPEIPLHSHIPKIIHQIYLGGDLPSLFQKNIQLQKSRNPDWSFVLYDDEKAEEFIVKHYGYKMLEKYLSIDEAYAVARSDLLRYLLLYVYGGVYLDVKSSFKKNISSVIHGDESYIISQWRNGPSDIHEGWGLHTELGFIKGGEFQQWHIIAAAGHPFLKEVIKQVVYEIDHYSARRTGTSGIGVFRLTGPIVYTKTIAPLLNKHKCKIVPNEDYISMEYSIISDSLHQNFNKVHYTMNDKPIIKSKGFKNIYDKLFVYFRGLKNKMDKRYIRAMWNKSEYNSY